MGAFKMFTGIIEAQGKVVGWKKAAGTALTLELAVPGVVERTLKKGGSLAVNGACLTVTGKKKGLVWFNVIEETLRRTMLGSLKKGDGVNLERPLPWKGRVEGHFVLGHVDGVGRIKKITSAKQGKSFLIAFPKSLRRFFLEKGSVAVDGVSLTLGKVSANGFWVHCIPHTLKVTGFGAYREGSAVNLEADILIKSMGAIKSSHCQ
jgi:riboflavin synthase